GRADVVSRPKDLGRDHVVDARPRVRSRHSRHREHPQRRALAALRQQDGRRVGRPLSFRRPARGAYRPAPDADLWRRELAGVSAVRPADRPLRLAGTAFALYLAYALSHLEVTPARVLAGLEFGQKFLAKLYPPDFHRWELLLKGLKASLEMAILASALGVVVSLPVSLLGARNLMPGWVTWPARMLMVVC